MPDDLFQLIFLALVLVGWLIRAAAERRQRRERAKRPKEVEGVPVPDSLPPVGPPRPPPPAPGSVARHTEDAVAGHARDAIGGHADAIAYGGLTGLASTAWAGTSESHETTAAADLHTLHRNALRRLGGGTDLEPGPDMVRAGILWSEVLGPCRAVRGPHRPPILARRRG